MLRHGISHKPFPDFSFSRFAGFTLIEVIMVIVIVGILAGMAIPRFDSFYGMKMESAAKKMITDIRYVQQIAVSRHTNTRIVFNPGNDTYTAQEETSPGSGTWNSITDPYTRSNLTMNFHADAQYGGIDLSGASFGGISTLQFNLEGKPADGGTVSLGYHGWNKTITIEANTGFIR
ncbi:MAG: prepilin-type N-terminal cleavage/methylation domain-containing protein [Candidatus Omnitrophica bacterium]|nr:prepilin-type N-terminal cleavage/methylation domain-containing protein [Candidatus Omnitrophota bacterium]